MKPRRVGHVAIAAALGVIVAVAATSIAQGTRKQSSPNKIPAYIEALLESVPTRRQIMDQLNAAASKECAAVISASPEEVQKEEEWLNGLMNNAKIRSERARELVIGVYSADPLVGVISSTHQERMDAISKYDDARFEFTVTTFIYETVGKCIEERKRDQEGARWIRGNWTAECWAAEGITPDESGRIDVQLFPDNSVTATVYPTEGKVGIDVKGELTPTGYFFLLPIENRGTMIQVEGNIHGFNRLSASGSISFDGNVEGYGVWRCKGTWSGR